MFKSKHSAYNSFWDKNQLWDKCKGSFKILKSDFFNEPSLRLENGSKYFIIWDYNLNKNLCGSQLKNYVSGLSEFYGTKMMTMQ